MDDLTTLMRQAVEEVEPTDRRAELHEAVAAASRRRFRRTVAGGLLAAAVVVTGVAVTLHSTDDPEPEPVGPPRAIDRSRDHRPAYALYYLGTTPQGNRLYREFRSGPGPDMTPATALSLLQDTPDDPDYQPSLWPTGTFSGAQVVNDVIDVEVADPASVGHRLDGMSAADAALSVEQVIYTVQAAVQEELPVQFTHDGSPVAEVLGVPTGEPLAAGDQLDVLALASISDPSERRVVEDSFSARGRASSFEGNIPWQLRGPDGSVVLSGAAQSYGWEEHLYPWATGRIDVSGLPPGDYTFLVMTDDPSGGAEGAGPTVDTRTIIIK